VSDVLSWPILWIGLSNFGPQAVSSPQISHQIYATGRADAPPSIGFRFFHLVTFYRIKRIYSSLLVCAFAINVDEADKLSSAPPHINILGSALGIKSYFVYISTSSPTVSVSRDIGSENCNFATLYSIPWKSLQKGSRPIFTLSMKHRKT